METEDASGPGLCVHPKDDEEEYRCFETEHNRPSKTRLVKERRGSHRRMKSKT